MVPFARYLFKLIILQNQNKKGELKFHSTGFQRTSLIRNSGYTNVNMRICGILAHHFNNGDYIHNLQAELLDYTPKGRRLKPNAIPTLNLPGHFIQDNEVSTSSTNRNKRMETKADKQAHEEVIILALNTEIPLILNQLPTTSIDENKDYKTLYYDIVNDHNKLKNDLSLQEN